LRVARKSVTGFGSSRDGGCGGPIVAQADSMSAAETASAAVFILGPLSFMRNKTE
jgi:hypothetical protein